MPSFVDLVPASETVSVKGVVFSVAGLSVESIARLFMRFPEVRAMVDKGALEAETLLKLSDAALAAVIAAGTACLGNVEQEAAIAKLALADKMKFINAIVRQTMPEGPGPFVELIAGLKGLVPSGEAPQPPAADSNSASAKPSSS